MSSSLPAMAKDISLGVTNSLPPYYIHETKSGVEIDIVKAAFRSMKYKINNYIYAHYKRSLHLLTNKNIDAVIGNKHKELFTISKVKIFSSATTLNYIDCAITLKSSGQRLRSFADYNDKKIWAFQSANVVLGDSYKAMAKRNPFYTEDND